MTEWVTRSQELCDRFTKNAHEIFGIDDKDTFLDPVTNTEETAGGLLAEITRQLRLHSAPPFTYQRLVELAELEGETREQYIPEKHGAAYLRSVLLLSRVTSSDEVFADFAEQMNEQVPAGIKLETITWAQFEEAPNPATFQADAKADGEANESQRENQGETAKDEAAKAEAAKDEAAKDEAAKDETAKDEAPEKD